MSVSIGDITGKIVITDAGGPVVADFAKKINTAADTILKSMSRATLATETSVREITAKLDKLKLQMKPTDSAKGLVADLDKLNIKLREEITAVKAGPAAIDALNKKRLEEANAVRIAAAQVQAGVSAESDLGKEIAKQFALHDRLQGELEQTAAAQAKAALAAEKQIATYRKMVDVGQILTTRVTLPLVAFGAGAVKIASDFESSFAGVRKTVDATEAEFKQLEAQIRSLAAGPDAIPIDVNKLNAVAEAAGQLGIAKGDIVAFTRTMADLGQTTNLTADEAATATAQFQNIFGAAGKEVDRFGSTLVALGNAGASTEKDIISMGLRIAGAGVQLGLSQGQVLAYASSLASMGIEAEAGGSAISKVMIDIALAVSKGGNELTNFASVSGMSAEQFKIAFKDNAAGAVASFIEGLGRMKAGGQDVLGTLDAMGITEIRMRDALLRASGAGDLLRNSLKLQAEAWRDNNALTDEAKKRYQTFESQLQLFWNRVKDVAITFGTALLPALLDALDAAQPWIDTLKSMAEGFANASPATQKTVLALGALAAAAGPVLFVTGQLLIAWGQVVAIGPKLISVLNSTSLAMKGVRLGLIGIIGVGIYKFIDGMIDKWKEAADATIQYQILASQAMGGALQSAQAAINALKASSGGKVSDTFFAQATEQVTQLNEMIKETQNSINKYYRDTAGVGLDPKLRNAGPLAIKPSELIEQEDLLQDLVGTMKTLVPVLSKVTVEGKKVDEVLGENNPFLGLDLGGDKSVDIIGDLIEQIERATGAMELLRAGEDITSIEALVSAAEMLDKGNLFDGTVQQVGILIERVTRLTAAFTLAIEARKKLAAAGGNLDDLIGRQFTELTSDPEMDKLLANLRAQKQLIGSVATDEERRLAAIQEALRLGIEGEALQRIILANNEEWNIELDETQLRFNEIYEQLSFIAEGIAYDLVANWRRAWEENESIVDVTVDTLRDSFLNVLQDIISQWLSQWFRAMAAWLARWIATQAMAKASSAALSTSTGGGTSGKMGDLASAGAQGYSTTGTSGWAGVEAGIEAYAGYALIAYGLFVVYKGFIEDHKRKFARVEIADGRWNVTAAHGKKYLDGVQTAAESIVNNLTKFLSDIDVEMERLGTVIVESSKHGWNVSIPGSTGKLFSSMEEAISYAQVLMLKYGQFADSVSLLVRSVISSTKAISIEQLASDIAFARQLETQNLEQSAAAIREAMDVAIAQWKRAEDLFLSFYDRNLPAFAEATLSILTRLSNSIWAQYNQLAGIEEDPAKAWERKKAQYRVERMMVEAQLKLWKLEIDARIANFKTFGPWLGGLNIVTKGTLKHIQAWVQAAEILDPALQALLDIQELITKTLAELPPLELPDTDPSKRRKGKGNKGQLADLRADLLDEIAILQAEAKGPLHAAFYDLQQGIAEFTKRAKEAKLPAEDLAKGVELLTEAFQRSIRQQARDYAGLETEFSRRLREVDDFFNELAALGQDASGMTGEEVYSLRSQALIQLGADLMETIAAFGGLSNPMLAINTRASELIANLEAFAETAGWTAEQIAEAREQIEAGAEFQRQQGINSLLGRLFNYLKEAGLYQEQAALFAQQQALLDIQLIEAQLRFYGALTAQTQEWIDAARNFVESSDFGGGNAGTFSDPIAVKVVPTGPDPWAEFSAGVKELVEAWRDGIEEFVQSTKDLLTDESVTNLTQAQQLDFAKAELEQLITAAKGGDLIALGKLDAARREYLSELRESEGGGYGYDKGFEWVMGQTADILAGAQEGEQALMATEFKKLTDAWELSVAKLSAEMTTTLYITTDEMVAAIYDAIGNSNPFNYNLMQSVGYGLATGPAPNLGFAYDSLAPMDRLHNGMPYTGAMPFAPDTTISTSNRFDRDALARLSALETYNESMARSLATIKDDISAIRRQN